MLTEQVVLNGHRGSIKIPVLSMFQTAIFENFFSFFVINRYQPVLVDNVGWNSLKSCQ